MGSHDHHVGHMTVVLGHLSFNDMTEARRREVPCVREDTMKEEEKKGEREEEEENKEEEGEGERERRRRRRGRGRTVVGLCRSMDCCTALPNNRLHML